MVDFVMTTAILMRRLGLEKLEITEADYVAEADHQQFVVVQDLQSSTPPKCVITLVSGEVADGMVMAMSRKPS
jgi:hypothetical protein